MTQPNSSISYHSPYQPLFQSFPIQSTSSNGIETNVSPHQKRKLTTEEIVRLELLLSPQCNYTYKKQLSDLFGQTSTLSFTFSLSLLLMDYIGALKNQSFSFEYSYENGGAADYVLQGGKLHLSDIDLGVCIKDETRLIEATAIFIHCLEKAAGLTFYDNQGIRIFTQKGSSFYFQIPLSNQSKMSPFLNDGLEELYLPDGKSKDCYTLCSIPTSIGGTARNIDFNIVVHRQNACTNSSSCFQIGLDPLLFDHDAVYKGTVPVWLVSVDAYDLKHAEQLLRESKFDVCPIDKTKEIRGGLRTYCSSILKGRLPVSKEIFRGYSEGFIQEFKESLSISHLYKYLQGSLKRHSANNPIRQVLFLLLFDECVRSLENPLDPEETQKAIARLLMQALDPFTFQTGLWVNPDLKVVLFFLHFSKLHLFLHLMQQAKVQILQEPSASPQYYFSIKGHEEEKNCAFLTSCPVSSFFYVLSHMKEHIFAKDQDLHPFLNKLQALFIVEEKAPTLFGEDLLKGYILQFRPYLTPDQFLGLQKELLSSAHPSLASTAFQFFLQHVNENNKAPSLQQLCSAVNSSLESTQHLPSSELQELAASLLDTLIEKDLLKPPSKDVFIFFVQLSSLAKKQDHKRLLQLFPSKTLQTMHLSEQDKKRCKELHLPLMDSFLQEDLPSAYLLFDWLLAFDQDPSRALPDVTTLRTLIQKGGSSSKDELFQKGCSLFEKSFKHRWLPLNELKDLFFSSVDIKNAHFNLSQYSRLWPILKTLQKAIPEEKKIETFAQELLLAASKKKALTNANFCTQVLKEAKEIPSFNLTDSSWSVSYISYLQCCAPFEQMQETVFIKAQCSAVKKIPIQDFILLFPLFTKMILFSDLKQIEKELLLFACLQVFESFKESPIPLGENHDKKKDLSLSSPSSVHAFISFSALLKDTCSYYLFPSYMGILQSSIYGSCFTLSELNAILSHFLDAVNIFIAPKNETLNATNKEDLIDFTIDLIQLWQGLHESRKTETPSKGKQEKDPNLTACYKKMAPFIISYVHITKEDKKTPAAGPLEAIALAKQAILEGYWNNQTFITVYEAILQGTMADWSLEELKECMDFAQWAFDKRLLSLPILNSNLSIFTYQATTLIDKLPPAPSLSRTALELHYKYETLRSLILKGIKDPSLNFASIYSKTIQNDLCLLISSAKRHLDSAQDTSNAPAELNLCWQLFINRYIGGHLMTDDLLPTFEKLYPLMISYSSTAGILKRLLITLSKEKFFTEDQRRLIPYFLCIVGGFLKEYQKTKNSAMIDELHSILQEMNKIHFFPNSFQSVAVAAVMGAIIEQTLAVSEQKKGDLAAFQKLIPLFAHLCPHIAWVNTANEIIIREGLLTAKPREPASSDTTEDTPLKRSALLLNWLQRAVQCAFVIDDPQAKLDLQTILKLVNTTGIIIIDIANFAKDHLQ